MFAAAEVDEGELRWASEAAFTMMACPDDLMAQDQWLAGLFSEGLVLSAGEVTIRLAEQLRTRRPAC